MPIASSYTNIGLVPLQDLHEIGGPIVTRPNVWLEARRPGHTAKGSGERREAPEAEVAELWLADLPNGLQAIENMKTCPATARVNITKAKTVMTIITHVKADLEENTPQPLPGAPNVDGFRVARPRGTTRRTQRFKRRGLNVGDLGSQRNMVTEASSRRTHNALRRETPSFTQVQGPRGEVKPLLPAFLYYDAISREEYKVLVIEL
jgi:hypothetical protein